MLTRSAVRYPSPNPHFFLGAKTLSQKRWLIKRSTNLWRTETDKFGNWTLPEVVLA